MDIEFEAGIGQTVAAAIAEDVGSGDLTARLVEPERLATATVTLRDEAVFCGKAWFTETLRQVDSALLVRWHVADGERCAADTVICSIEGKARSLLTAERTALNFIQTLSATATATAAFVAVLAGTGTHVLDTRKTLPGLRLAQKYAVLCGGGKNHRVGLYDAILIKENHIAAAGGIRPAVAAARKIAGSRMVEVEVESISEAAEALDCAADRLLLDNFTLPMLIEAVQLRDNAAANRKELEASGNITLDNIREVAETGVDYISVGALTKNIQSVDFSLRIQGRP